MEDARKQVLVDMKQAEIVKKVNEHISYTKDIYDVVKTQGETIESQGAKIVELEGRILAQVALANQKGIVPEVPVVGDQVATTPAVPATETPAATPAATAPAADKPADKPAETPAAEPTKKEPSAAEPKK